MRASVLFLGGYLLAGCSGQVVAIKVPERDPNASAHYTCEPKGESGFECVSRQTFNQYDREVAVNPQHCAYGVYRIYVETDWRGNVTRIQYSCASAPAGEFPREEAHAR